jgi:hypothetical protein
LGSSHSPARCPVNHCVVRIQGVTGLHPSRSRSCHGRRGELA